MVVVCNILADQVIQVALATDRKDIPTLAVEGSEPSFCV